MPYIMQEDRTKPEVTNVTKALQDWFPSSAGELNYMLTQVCLRYREVHDNTYNTHNTIVGALECAKQEYYRRECVPYEDKKIQENGDVYGSKT